MLDSPAAQAVQRHKQCCCRLRTILSLYLPTLLRATLPANGTIVLLHPESSAPLQLTELACMPGAARRSYLQNMQLHSINHLWALRVPSCLKRLRWLECSAMGCSSIHT